MCAGQALRHGPYSVESGLDFAGQYSRKEEKSGIRKRSGRCHSLRIMATDLKTSAGSAPRETLEGLVERVTFFSEETGFAVLKVKVRGQRDLVAVVGSAPSVAAGEYVRAEGFWVRNREHGLQFKAAQLKLAPPSSKEGIERYLGSGMIKGIGPVHAKRLVEKFGTDIFDVIEQYSPRLEEVEGIGPVRRRKIKSAWAEQRVVRDIMVFLHSHGVSTSRAVRIYKVYGEAAIQKVEANPYDLAKDVHGIGFKSADQIAENLGVPRESPVRLAAGLAHVLLEATQDGHCALPRELLLKEGSKLLETDGDQLLPVLESLIARQELVEEIVEDSPLVYHPALRWAEMTVARILTGMARAESCYPPIDLPKAVDWSREKLGIELAEGQQEALRKALSHRLLVITGGPGVGKTTLMRAILRILKAKGVHVVQCAPTGRAAKRLSEVSGHPAKTIHRLLEVQGDGRFSRNEKNPLKADLVVVDETSMVDINLMHHLLRAVPAEAHLILVGDMDQLPSVGPGLVVRDLIESGKVPVARLTEVFRQAQGSWIIRNAHRIREGQMPQVPSKEDEADFYFLERQEPEAVHQLILELVTERLPRRYGLDAVDDIQVLCPMNRGVTGAQALNIALQKRLHPEGIDPPMVERFGMRFCVGDKVIQMRNNYDKDVYNGDLGRVAQLDAVEQTLIIRFDRRNVEYEWSELDEMTLAYAITVHKSQGSEFPAVVMPLTTQHYPMLQRNLVYTGMTRGRKLVVCVGQKNAVAIAARNQVVRKRYSGLLWRLQQETNGHRLKLDDGGRGF